MKSLATLIAAPVLVFAAAIAGHYNYGDGSNVTLSTATAQNVNPLPSPDPPAPLPTPPAPEPVKDVEPQIFTITTDEERFPSTAETVNGQTVRCVRYKTGDVPVFGVQGAGDRKVDWLALPPSPNFRKHDVEGRIGHEATIGSRISVNTAVFASVASEDGKTSHSDVILVIAEGFTPAPGPIPGPTPGPGPTPDPGPGPTPDPSPNPNPSPISKPGLHVAIYYETEKVQDLTEDQQVIIDSAKLRSYLNSKCAKDETGKPAWKIGDGGTVFSDDGALAVYKQMAAVKSELVARIVICNGARWTVEALPANVDAVVALIKNYE